MHIRIFKTWGTCLEAPMLRTKLMMVYFGAACFSQHPMFLRETVHFALGLNIQKDTLELFQSRRLRRVSRTQSVLESLLPA